MSYNPDFPHHNALFYLDTTTEQNTVWHHLSSDNKLDYAIHCWSSVSGQQV